MANYLSQFLSRKEIDPTNGMTYIGEDVLNPDYQKDPEAAWNQEWGDSSYGNLGRINLAERVGGGGMPQKGAGNKWAYFQNDDGTWTFAPNSLEEAQQYQQQYGGKIERGYIGAEESAQAELGVPGQEEQGWKYFYTAPGEDYKKQREVTNQIGFTKEPEGMDAMSDGQFAALLASLFVGGAAAGGAFGGAAAGAGAGEGAGMIAGQEAGMLGGSAVGSIGAEGAAAGLGAVGGAGELAGSAGELAGFEAGALGGPAVGAGGAGAELAGAGVAGLEGVGGTTAATGATGATGAGGISSFLGANKGLIGLGTSLVGGLIGNNSAKKASEQQQAGINAGIAELRRQSDQTRADLSPYRERGYQSANKLAMMMGLEPDKGTYKGDMATIKQDPVWNSGYQSVPQFANSRNAFAAPMKIIKGY